MQIKRSSDQSYVCVCVCVCVCLNKIALVQSTCVIYLFEIKSKQTVNDPKRATNNLIERKKEKKKIYSSLSINAPKHNCRISSRVRLDRRTIEIII